MYDWLSSGVSRMGAPQARKLATHAIKLAALAAPADTPSSLRRDVMGLSFPSPVGLAAGFDKQGTLYPSLPPLGFGFAEIGSVIPLPEPQRSPGLNAVAGILARHSRPHAIPLGASISMNRATAPERMADDYLACMQALWKYADYFTVNLGVRAGPDLHLPQHRATLRSVLAAVSSAQARMAAEHGLRRSVVVKVDQSRGDTDALLACVQEFAFDGLVLSGAAPAGEERRALGSLERAAGAVNGRMPVISVGGIRTPQDVSDRLSAGAALVQLYSAIVESGPLLPRRINARLSNPAKPLFRAS